MMDMQINSADGYHSVRQKCQRIAAILRDIALLIGDKKETWIALESGDTVMPGLGLHNEASQVASAVKYLQQGIFNVAVCGSYKTGKSTLLNALLGSKLLPAQSQPTTAVVTTLLHGTQKAVTIYEEGKKQAYSVSWEQFSENFTLSQTDISTLNAQGNIDSRLKNVYYAQVESQSALLANGVRLFDTPGLGVSLTRPLITPGFLKRADTALLIVFNAIKPFPKDVQAFLSGAIGSRRRENIFFVFNRMDQLPEERKADLQREARRVLRQHFLDESFTFDHALYTQRVFFVSARPALEARLSDPQDSAALEASGLPALERAVESFLIGAEQFLRAIEATLEATSRIVERAHQRIAELKEALQNTRGAPQRFLIVREQIRLDSIEQKLLALMEKANRIARGYHTATEKLRLSTAPSHTGQLLPGQSGPLEDWDAQDMPDIADHLAFLGQLLERVDLPSSLRQDMRGRMNEIFYRYTDPSLYLAVVGEFSSGKSTFINALLRQELLKTSVLVTTSVPTYIRYGPVPNVEVLFKKQLEPLSYRKDVHRLWKLIHFFTQQNNGQIGDLQECIHLLTAGDRVASQVEHLVISHPSPFLADGIVIVDTPGTNADNEVHAQMTTNLLQNEVDAVVITVHASFPFPSTLRELLTTHLKASLHRCLFVVTQMDKIPHGQQAGQLGYVRASLTELGIKPLMLYEAAPQVALDLFGGAGVAAPELEHWGRAFYELEGTIWEHLHRQRTQRITERLARLLATLFEQLDQHLRKNRSRQTPELQKDLSELARRCKALQSQL